MIIYSLHEVLVCYHSILRSHKQHNTTQLTPRTTLTTRINYLQKLEGSYFSLYLQPCDHGGTLFFRKADAPKQTQTMRKRPMQGKQRYFVLKDTLLLFYKVKAVSSPPPPSLQIQFTSEFSSSRSRFIIPFLFSFSLRYVPTLPKFIQSSRFISFRFRTLFSFSVFLSTRKWKPTNQRRGCFCWIGKR